MSYYFCFVVSKGPEIQDHKTHSSSGPQIPDLARPSQIQIQIQTHPQIHAHKSFRASLRSSGPPLFRFLDIGSGAGYMSACAALLVGRSGSVTSMDIRSSAIEMSRASMKELLSRNKE